VHVNAETSDSLVQEDRGTRGREGAERSVFPAGLEERRSRNSKERIFLFQLGEDPGRQLLHREGMKPIRHCAEA